MVCKTLKIELIQAPSGAQLNYILRDSNEIDQWKLKHNEEQIKEWIKFQPHFPLNIDPIFIRNMLRGAKHILEKAQLKLEANLAVRHLRPEIFQNRCPTAPDILQAMDVVNIGILPKMTPEGYRILVHGLHRPDPAEFSFQAAAKLYFMFYDFLMTLDHPFSGDIAIFDASGSSPSHITQFFGPNFKMIGDIPREAYAIRLKAVHIVNAPKIFSKMMSLLKAVLHPKVRNSVFVHSNYDDLLNRYGADYLPSDYGGNLKSVRDICLDWYGGMQAEADWFQQQERVKITAVPKRVRAKLGDNDQLGIEGSFRQLNID